MNNLREDIWAQPRELIRSAEQLVTLQAAQLQEAARLLLSRPNVISTGMGSSHFISIAASCAGLELGLKSLPLETGELCYNLSPWLTEAVLVVVSRSGESAETVKLLEVAEGAHCPILAVTNCPDSTLGKRADVVLTVGADPDHNVSVKMYNGPLQTLILAYAEAAGSGAASYLDPLRKAWSAVGQRLGGWEAQLDTVAALFQGKPTQYYLGRGAGYASALEGRLLSEEASKYPATADTAAGFRHGSIEVVDDDFRGMLFLTPGTPMELTASLAAAIERFGGRSLVFAPDSAAVPPVTLTLRFPDVDRVLAPLFDITPAQLLALKMAEWRGVDCNQFFRCSYIIKEECED